MDDDLFKGALGLDSDDDDADMPAASPAEPDRATQRLQAAGLDSDNDDEQMQEDVPNVKDELPQTPPAPGSPADDPSALKGAI